MLQPLAMLLATSLSQVPDAPKKINLRAFLAGDKMRVKVWRPDNFASWRGRVRHEHGPQQLRVGLLLLLRSYHDGRRDALL